MKINTVSAKLLSPLLFSAFLFASCEKNEEITATNYSTSKGESITSENKMSSSPGVNDTVIVTDQYYFRKNFLNTGSVYILNTPVRFLSGTNVVFGTNTVIKLGSSFPSSQKSSLFQLNGVKNFSLSGGKIDASDVKDGIIIMGASSNVKLKGIQITGAKQFGIQVYGKGSSSRPHHLDITNIKTTNCVAGGIYVNSANDINISYCSNNGGKRAIGVESPKPATNTTTLTDAQRHSYNINISNCQSINTTAFGIQLYYARNSTISNCNINGSKLSSGDKSCITIDRSNNIVLDRDTTSNSPLHNVFITGSSKVTVTNNVITSTNGTINQIQVYYNNEPREDLVLKECKDIFIENNKITGGKIGILANGCINGKISANTIKNTSSNSIYLMKQKRSSDDVQMLTQNIDVQANITSKSIFCAKDILNLNTVLK